MFRSPKIIFLLLGCSLLLSSCSSSVQNESVQNVSSDNYRAELCRTINDLDKNRIHIHELSDTCYYFSVDLGEQTQIMRYGIQDTSLDQTFLCLENPEKLLSFSVNAKDEVAVAVWHSLLNEAAQISDNSPEGLELRKYDADGTLLWSLELSDVEDASCFRGITLDDNGSLALLEKDALRIYQEDGELQTYFPLSRENASQLIMMGQELIFILYANEKGMYLEQYDGSSERPVSEQTLSGFHYLFDHEDKFYYIDSNTLGLYDWQENVKNALLELTAVDVDISCLCAVAETEEDIFAAGQWNTEGTALELIRLIPRAQDPDLLSSPADEDISRDGEAASAESPYNTAVPAEETAQELVFAVLNPGSFQSSAVNFNRKNTAYRIQLQAYELAQLDMLNVALAADGGIDLVEITGRYAYNAYVANDYLLDLTPFLADSDKLSLESFIEPVAREFLRDGKIYAIPRTINVGTLACPTSILEGRESWTVDEFLNLMTQYPNAFSGNGKSVVEIREKLLRMVLYRGLNGFVDMTDAKSMLGDEYFKNVLETINALPITASNLSPEERAAEGETVFWEILNLQSTRTLQQLEWRSGEELTLIGYPVYDNTDGEVSAGLIGFGDFVGIHSTSQRQEGAWLYLEQYLSGAFMVSSLGFTTGADAFEEKLSEDMGEDYVEYFLEGIPYPAITQEQSDKVRRAYETAFYYTEEQQAIVALILEEAESYFCGDKSLEDTVRIMDNRVQLYLDETR